LRSSAFIVEQTIDFAENIPHDVCCTACFPDRKACFFDHKARFSDQKAHYRNHKACFLDSKAQCRNHDACCRDHKACFFDRVARFRLDVALTWAPGNEDWTNSASRPCIGGNSAIVFLTMQGPIACARFVLAERLSRLCTPSCVFLPFPERPRVVACKLIAPAHVPFERLCSFPAVPSSSFSEMRAALLTFLCLSSCFLCPLAAAQADDVAGFAGDFSSRIAAIEALGIRGGDDARRVLDALEAGQLGVSGQGRVLIVDGETVREAASGETDIFLYPGKSFQVIDGLITNFHLPESTLIMLVSAFCSTENTMQAYKTAVREEYRFFSFGDAMLIL
jgi:hypothetical protein